MPRKCSICTNDSREEINEALVAGTAYRQIASHFDVSTAALRRHEQNHLPAQLTKAKEAEDAAHADSLIEQIGELREDARRILEKAETSQDYQTALRGVRELARLVELLAKLQGELDERNQVNIVLSAEWQRVRTVILETLEPYPEARIALVEALHEVENEHRDTG